MTGRILVIYVIAALALLCGCKGKSDVNPPQDSQQKTLLSQISDKLKASRVYTSKQTALLVDFESLKMDWKNAFDYSGQDLRTIEEDLRTKTNENFDFLLTVAKGSEPVGKKIASAVLGFSNNKNALPVLLNNLYFPSNTVKANSAISIGMLADKDTSISLLVDLMAKDPDADVRNSCAFAIYKIVQPGNDKGSYETLIKGLDDPDEGVRNQSVRALMKIGKKEAAEHLIKKTLSDPVPTVSDNTILALQTLECYDPVVEILVTNIESGDFKIRANSLRVLKLLTKIDLGDDQIAWRKWWDHNKEQFLKEKERVQ
ncbi:MAG: HEAT repeat domain-containing protein [Planctomycetes bacterium]|nr:HEAT repeat domain-containing protein [Planctomycetota bacterium]